MSYRKSVIHLAPELIAQRGGKWVCHYCGYRLVPDGVEIGTEPYYHLVMTECIPPSAVRSIEAHDLYARGQLRYWSFSWKLDGFRRFEVDHIVPISKGGTNQNGNLVVCCAECNRKKGNRDYIGFLNHSLGGAK